MREFRFYFPKGNDETVDIKALRRGATGFIHNMLRHAGGFTATDGAGWWQDAETGRLYTEPVTIYHVAIGDDEAEDAIITEFLFALRRGGEKAAYYVLPDGEAKLVTL